MSTTIDERVVEMRFDNRHFENNVQTSVSTLEKLKRSLNLTGAAEGMKNIDRAAARVDMSTLGNAVDTVRMRFSALEVMAVTTLANITNSAVNTGKRMISALTIDPIKTGFQEYETQINAVQTILANTSHNGTNLDQVNAALDELNTYADKTIYNFTQMTKNIGTFTAAGVDLDTSVKSIQGIANLAAVSGSTSQQASTAMYQLSQALAAGRVSLMDWNSVVNAGMGGKVFQDALVRTSEMMGTGAQKYIDKYGSFRESLTKGEWLTTDVLTKTLEQFTMAAEEGSEQWDKFKKSLMDEGYTEQQATEILKMANTATDAATKVKTFTQLWDTLKESAQSGWTQTWEIIIGDFEEAKAMLTNISNVVGDFINTSAQARNDLLQGWKDAGGRTDVLESFANTFKFLGEVIKPIGEAFREVFPALKVEQLTAFTSGLKSFTERLKLSAESSEKLKAMFKGVFSIFDLGRKVLVSFGKAIGDLLTSSGVGSLATFLLDIGAVIGNFFTSINEGFDSDGLTGVLSGIVGFISDVFGTTVGHIENFGDLLSAAGDVISNVLGKIWGGVKNVFGWISETFSAGDIFAGLAGGGIFLAFNKLSGLFELITEKSESIFGKKGGKGSFIKEIKENFIDILGGVKDSLNSFATGIKISSLVSIAIAVGILSASLKTISGIDATSIAKSLGAIGIMVGMLSWTMGSITKTLDGFKSTGLVKAGISLMLIAEAINILANAMEKIGSLPLTTIAKGLIGIGGGLAALSVALKIIGKTKISLSTSVAMIALAESCKMLGDALGKFGSMSWDEIKKGLTGMGLALAEFVAALVVLDKSSSWRSIFSSTALLIAVQSLSDMADGLKKFSSMSWGEIGRGLAGMGGALFEVAVILDYLGSWAGFSSIFASGAILIVTQGLENLADGLKSFASMSWSEIGRGLAGMGGALAEVAGITGALGYLTGFAGILGSGSILIVIQGLTDLAAAFKEFGSMSTDEIGRGFAAMGGALTELAGVVGTLGYLTGFAGIIGSGSILIAVQSLGDIADALKEIGSMTWDQIKIGLAGMGGALTEISVITGASGYLTNFAGLIGSGSLLLAVQGLGDLADALKKFGEMSWDEIGRGLTAMGGALGETALGGILNTLSGFGALAITEMAGSLGTLADSVKKWTGVTVPEGLGLQLASLAVGVEQFTFAGIGAGALSEAAPAIGILADSVKKWTGVIVPDGIGDKLKTLADGIEKFSFAGMGASALASAAPAVGTLADSVKKWAGVTIPENIQSGLKNLASGVKSFSFAFMGGWSLSSIVGPLGNLAGAIKKWNGVSIPDGLASKLKNLASGVKSFSFAFMGGWSLSSIIGPLGNLAGAIKKWNGVSIPDGLGERLHSLADGLVKFAYVGDISQAASSISTLAGSIKELSSISFNDIGSSMSGLTAAINKMIADAQSKIKSAQGTFKTDGAQLMISFTNGVKSNSKGISTECASALSDAVSRARGYYDSFFSAGYYVVSGFAGGISENTWLAEASATAMAQSALNAARRALRVKSPSRAFYEIGDFAGLGFVNALSDYVSTAREAGGNMADAARVGLATAAANMTRVIDRDIDMSPTITPVFDLDAVKQGANSINNMLNLGSSVGIAANISSTMSRNNQNGGNSDVVTAINKLRKDLGNVGSTVYNVNGITYDDGSNVSDAIEEIARWIRIEGRV